MSIFDRFRLTGKCLFITGGSWGVELHLFLLDQPVQSVRKVHRFTLDVSNVVPGTIGPMRSWFTR